MMGRLWRRLRYWLTQDGHEAALAEELELHRALKQRELEASGLPTDAARVAARRELGNVTLAREDSRAEWIWPWLESVWQDTRIAVRALVRQPGFTLLSVLVLGVAIGLNTTLFTVFAGLALRPMAGIADADRVVTVSGLNPQGRFPSGMSYPEFRHLAAGSRTLAGLSATRTTSVSLEAGGTVRSTITFAVSGNYFDMLGVRMAHGRGFRPDEDRAGAPRPVVVLGHRLWQTRFGADPALVGQDVQVNDASYTVVGIAPPEFTGRSGTEMMLWVPMASLPVLRPHDPGERELLTRADDCCVNVIGRLADGVSRDRARADLQVLSDGFRAGVSQPSRPTLLGGTQFLGPRDTGTAVAVIGGLFVALLLVLLLACANVGNLVLARAAARTGEIGVRLALGAGRPRLVRQLLTEGLVLALLASTAGIAVATWLPGIVLDVTAGQPAPFAIETDVSVIAYAILLAGLACLAFALAPALHATRLGSMVSLRQATTTRSSVRMRSVLLGVQVAVTVILLTSAGLLLRGVERARQIDPGFRTDGLRVATLELPEGTYDIPRATAFLADLASGLRDSGLESFGFTTTEPFSGFTRFAGVRLPGQGEERTQGIEFISVSQGYLEMLGIPMTAGRAFRVGDRGRPVAIVNESAARRFWSDAGAVGQSLVIGDGDRVLEVVGVLKDAHIDDFDAVTPLLFLPLERAQADDFPRLVFRSDGPAATALVTTAVARMEGRARLEIVPLTARLEDELTELMLAPLAASALGLFGLGLATVGMFGVFGYVVRQRTREIGIRIALGARSGEIIRLVLTGTSRPVVAGLVAGILGALGASQVLRSELYGASPLDPLTYAVVALLLSVAAMAASYVPARRAVRLDPTQALRE